MSLLSCAGLCVDVAGRRLVRELTLHVAAGEFVAVLGENGVGKTLTLHTLAGLRAPAAGAVQVLGQAIEEWPRRALAQRLALLAQAGEDPFPCTVLEAAAIGRHPHIDFWRWESEQDLELTRAALTAVDLAGQESRDVQTLSGGERRRVAVAAALAQDPRVYLLDEPTNHLDPHHQLQVLRLFRARADAGCAIITSLHDATVAAQYADRALLLFGEGCWMYGDSAQVLTAEHLSRLYRTPIEQIEHRGRRVFVGG
jgi:iron complex transport system ATP-binding protein